MKELDLVILNESLEGSHLKKGDVGTIVSVYAAGKGFEVEFLTFDGSTVGVYTLSPHQIRKAKSSEIMSARPLLNS